MRKVIGLLLVCSLGLLTPARVTSATVDRPIQPGAPIRHPNQFPDNVSPYQFDRCTLGYVFRDEHKKLFIITAGHCTQKIGERMFSERKSAFGSVVFREIKGTDDFALIRIAPSHYREVQPAVRVWGGPTGYTTPDTVHPGDEILFTGDSFVLGDIPATRARQGVLVSQDARHFSADTSASEGDSGGPFLMAKTGRALGIVWDFGTQETPPSTDAGPTIQHILSLLARAGWHLNLVTAPFRPPH